MSKQSFSKDEEYAPFLHGSETSTVSSHHDEEEIIAPIRKHKAFSKWSFFSTPILLLQIFLLLANIAWTIYNMHSATPLATSIPSSTGNHGTSFIAAVAMSSRTNIINLEAPGAPISLREETWNLPIGKRSHFTDLDLEVADAAWETVNMGGKRERLPQFMAYMIGTSC